MVSLVALTAVLNRLILLTLKKSSSFRLNFFQKVQIVFLLYRANSEHVFLTILLRFQYYANVFVIVFKV